MAEDVGTQEDGLPRTVTIEHPSGHVGVILLRESDQSVQRAGIIRTARRRRHLSQSLAESLAIASGAFEVLAAGEAGPSAESADAFTSRTGY